jgi:hypothetical protein
VTSEIDVAPEDFVSFFFDAQNWLEHKLDPALVKMDTLDEKESDKVTYKVKRKTVKI